MFDQLPKPGRLPAAQPSVAPRQHRLMLMALSLLLVALGLVLYRDRDFWFPNTEQAEQTADSPLQQNQPVVPATISTPRTGTSSVP